MAQGATHEVRSFFQVCLACRHGRGCHLARRPGCRSDGASNDNLNAVLWDQTSVEFKANALGAYALGRVRLDEALADKTWTAAPVEQTGAFQDLPPAIILDVDDTVLNTSAYQAWTIAAARASRLRHGRVM